MKEECEIVTTKSKTIASNDACLDDSILLPSKRFIRNAKLREDNGIKLHKEETEEASRDIE